MVKKSLLVLLLFILLLPSLTEHFVYAQGELDILPWVKLAVHILVPLLVTVFVFRESLRNAIVEPFSTGKGGLKKSILLGTHVGLLAMAAIFGAYVVFAQLINSTSIVQDLSSSGIDKAIFPFVALWIIFINPVMEEFFWRGFIYHRGVKLVSSPAGKKMVLIGTGLVFALHHTIIVQHWFNWWQFALTTIFLACAGVAFNLMYERTGSIIPSLTAHFMADLAIIITGFQLFGFFVS